MFGSIRRYPLLGLALLAGAASSVHATLQIVAGGTWTADNGRHMQAHGAGIIQVNGTYYMVGEDKTDGSAFQNVNCYSSRDLVRWKFEGALLSRTSSVGDLGPGRIVERPKVIYNERTRKYVLWMHIDSSDYKDARAGVATGDTVCGKYTYIRSMRPLGFQSRDSGLFKDDDGTAYLLAEDRENGLRINRLTDDYLDMAGTQSTYRWAEKYESPAMVKLQGRYYMFSSRLTGWDPNDNMYSTATSISGPWSAWKIFADQGSNTYASQSTFILPYGGADGRANVMYMGDRWVSGNLHASTYVWLPLTISGTTVTMKNQPSGWVPNLSAEAGASDPASGGSGAWTAAPEEAGYEGETAQLAGNARTVSCSGCSGGNAAGYIGGPEGGSVTLSGLRSGRDALTTVKIRFINGDSSPRYANVAVNGAAPVRVAFLPTRGSVSTSVVHAQLRSGSGNTVVVSGVDGGWGPDVDRLVVPLA